LRVFIAVDLNEDQKDELCSMQKELKKEFNSVKWVEPANLHVTLKFIGEAEEEELDLFSSLVKKAVKGFTPFEVSLKKLGFFPHPGKPRIIWVGVDQGGEELKSIWKEVEINFQEKGYPFSDKPFNPHVTIGRIRRVQKKLPVQKIINEYRDISLSTKATVNNVTIYRSDLRSHGAVYTPLDKINLE